MIPKRQSIWKKHRLKAQGIFFLSTNGYWKGFIQGSIFQGGSKKLCVPGLNCYSCPGAFFSCPIGALQQIMGDGKHAISYYVLGLLGIFGVLLGRLICGFLCPMGMLQDWLGRLSEKKVVIAPWMIYIKYGILCGILVIPFFFQDTYGQTPPLFCSYICPSGTLFAGIPLLAVNSDLRLVVGRLFYLKISILLGVMVASIPIKRFFCKILCPLGAMYSFFNKISIYQIKVNKDTCIHCGRCQTVCPMDVDIVKNPQDSECIRCAICEGACPTQAISSGFALKGEGHSPDNAKPVEDKI